jgi:hypothetical protein
MDSYTFWTACSGILYHSSWNTTSSYFRDVGHGNLFLTLVSKTDPSVSIVFKSDDCPGQGRSWSSPSCSSIMTEQFQLCEWLPNLSTYSLAVIRPWRLKIPQYCSPNHHGTSAMLNWWNRTRHFELLFLECSPNVNSSWCRKQREGRLIRPHHECVFQLSDVLVLWSWHHHLRIWALLFVIRGSGIAALPWMLRLRSSRQRFFVETGSSTWIFNSAAVHLCWSRCMISRNNPSQCTTISFCQCWFSPTVPLRWCYLPMIRVCRHNLRNCRSRYA